MPATSSNLPCTVRAAPRAGYTTRERGDERGARGCAARRGGDPDTVFLPAGCCWLLAAGGHDLLQTFPTRRRDE